MFTIGFLVLAVMKRIVLMWSWVQPKRASGCSGSGAGAGSSRGGSSRNWRSASSLVLRWVVRAMRRRSSVGVFRRFLRGQKVSILLGSSWLVSAMLFSAIGIVPILLAMINRFVRVRS